MTAPFRLKKTIGETYNMDLEDTLNTKRALARLGHLEEPEDGFDEYPDLPMIEAVKSFQRDQGLAVDGVMKPDGPTLERLNETLSAHQPPAPSSLNLLTHEPRDPIQRHEARLPERLDPTQAGANRHRPSIEGVQVAQAKEVTREPAGAMVWKMAPTIAATMFPELFKRKSSRDHSERSDIMSPEPTLLVQTPLKETLPDRMENPKQIFEIPALTGTPLDPAKPTVLVFPALRPDEFGDGIVERRERDDTKKQLDEVRDYYEGILKWEHIGGGRFSARHKFFLEGKVKVGDEQRESRIPGSGAAFGADSRPGSHFTDLTFRTPEGRIVHIQTVDVDKNGNATTREQDIAYKIFRALDGEDLHLIPKRAPTK